MWAFTNSAMPLACRRRSAGELVILDLRGHLVDDEAGGSFHGLLRRFARGGATVLLNLRHLAPLNMSGLCALLADLVKFRQNGGDLGLLCVPQATLDLLRRTGTITAFPIFASERAAVKHFMPARIARSPVPPQAERTAQPASPLACQRTRT